MSCIDQSILDLTAGIQELIDAQQSSEAVSTASKTRSQDAISYAKKFLSVFEKLKNEILCLKSPQPREPLVKSEVIRELRDALDALFQGLNTQLKTAQKFVLNDQQAQKSRYENFKALSDKVEQFLDTYQFKKKVKQYIPWKIQDIQNVYATCNSYAHGEEAEIKKYFADVEFNLLSPLKCSLIPYLKCLRYLESKETIVVYINRPTDQEIFNQKLSTALAQLGLINKLVSSVSNPGGDGNNYFKIQLTASSAQSLKVLWNELSKTPDKSCKHSKPALHDSFFPILARYIAFHSDLRDDLRESLKSEQIDELFKKYFAYLNLENNPVAQTIMREQQRVMLEDPEQFKDWVTSAVTTTVKSYQSVDQVIPEAQRVLREKLFKIINQQSILVPQNDSFQEKLINELQKHDWTNLTENDKKLIFAAAFQSLFQDWLRDGITIQKALEQLTKLNESNLLKAHSDNIYFQVCQPYLSSVNKGFFQCGQKTLLINLDFVSQNSDTEWPNGWSYQRLIDDITSYLQSKSTKAESDQVGADSSQTPDFAKIQEQAVQPIVLLLPNCSSTYEAKRALYKQISTLAFYQHFIIFTRGEWQQVKLNNNYTTNGAKGSDLFEEVNYSNLNPKTFADFSNSLSDGKNPEKLKELIEQMIPQLHRFVEEEPVAKLFLAICYCYVGKLKEAETLIHELKESGYDIDSRLKSLGLSSLLESSTQMVHKLYDEGISNDELLLNQLLPPYFLAQFKTPNLSVQEIKNYLQQYIQSYQDVNDHDQKQICLIFDRIVDILGKEALESLDKLKLLKGYYKSTEEQVMEAKLNQLPIVFYSFNNQQIHGKLDELMDLITQVFKDILSEQKQKDLNSKLFELNEQLKNYKPQSENIQQMKSQLDILTGQLVKKNQNIATQKQKIINKPAGGGKDADTKNDVLKLSLYKDDQAQIKHQRKVLHDKLEPFITEEKTIKNFFQEAVDLHRVIRQFAPGYQNEAFNTIQEKLEALKLL